MQRIFYLDNAKLIAIVLMVLGHCTIKHNIPFCGEFIYSFHMPLFFVISGYFVKIINVDSAIKKYAKSLLIPYLCAIFFAILVLILIRVYNTNAVLIDFAERFFWGSANFIPGACNGDVPRSMALWFLPALFWGSLYLIIIERFIPNEIFKYIIILFVFVFSFYSIKYYRLPFAIQQGGVALFYLWVGHYIKKKEAIDRIFEINTLVKLLIICLWIFTIYMGGVSLGECRFGGRFTTPIIVLGSLSGVYYVVWFCRSCLKGDSKLGQYTLYVMLGQSIVQFLLDYNDNYITNGYHFDDVQNLCLNIIGSVFFLFPLKYLVRKTQAFFTDY